MKFYQELTIIPQSEIPLYEVWRKLFTQIHIALADVNRQHRINTIGVSFPNYQYVEKQNVTVFATLGYRLRVFAPSERELQILDLEQWLARLTDYVHIKSIQPVPDKHDFVVVRRYWQKDMEKQAQRHMQFINKKAEQNPEIQSITLQQALVHCLKFRQPEKRYPFILMTSETNQTSYHLNIAQESCQTEQAGTFTTYGINTRSGGATVPHW